MAALKEQVSDEHTTFKSKLPEEYCCSCLKEAALCTVYNKNIPCSKYILPKMEFITTLWTQDQLKRGRIIVIQKYLAPQHFIFQN
jgi:hypothetical protein